ncbi:MAG: SCO6880 family protein, partial [Actinomycetes bacterium]
MTSTENAAPTYVFGRRDRGGLLLGLRPNQIMVLSVGAVAILVGLLSGGGQAAVLAVAISVAAGALALFPIQGRVLVDWVRPVGNYLYLRATGQGRYLGSPRALHRCRYLPRLDLPGLGQQLRVLEARTADGPVAVLRLRDRWTVVLQVRGTNYVLADRASQERRVSAWGALLAQCGQEGSHIAGLQWLERTLPDTGHALHEWWSTQGDPTSAYAETYADLIRDVGPTATRHETFVAVSIDGHRMRRAIRQAGGGPEGATKALLTELQWV